jgi:hypothetical protein
MSLQIIIIIIINAMPWRNQNPPTICWRKNSLIRETLQLELTELEMSRSYLYTE